MTGRVMFYWMATILLVVRPCIRADRPVDFQRKIHVRMAWPSPQLKDSPQQFIPAASFSRQMLIRFPSSGSNAINKSNAQHPPDSVEPKNKDPFVFPLASSGSDVTAEEVDYPLDSYVSLSLSSGGSDAEGAELKSSRSGKSASKVDLLQQLLRLAPAAVESGSYDKCNHPLHSWLCTKETNPPPTTKQPEVFPGASFDDVQIFFVPTTNRPPPPPPVRIATESWDGVDPCTHPFHSWMCKPKAVPSPKPEASRLEENLLLPPLTTTTTTPQPPTTIKTIQKDSASGWDGADPCTHPFHSWLCAKRPVVAPRTTTTTLRPFIPDASFFIPEVNLPPPPTTTKPPAIIIRTLAPKKGWDEADSCSHPFHSWLCAKPKVRTTTTPPPPPPPPPPPTAPPKREEEAVVLEPAPSSDQGNQLVPDATPPPPTPKQVKVAWDESDSCSHPFHSWLCAKLPASRTTRPTTSKPPPTPPPPDVQQLPLPDASNFRIVETIPLVVETTTHKAISKSGWEGADPCTHPFHSWLCNRSPPIKQSILKSAVRIGRQSQRDQDDEEAVEESSRWQNFESLRLVAPSGGGRKGQ